MMGRERPGTEVVPSYYPISPAKKAAVTALSLVQYGAIGAILFADALSELLRTHLGVQVSQSTPTPPQPCSHPALGRECRRDDPGVSLNLMLVLI